MAVGIDEIRVAAKRIAPYVHRTPVMRSELINEIAGNVDIDRLPW